MNFLVKDMDECLGIVSIIEVYGKPSGLYLLDQSIEYPHTSFKVARRKPDIKIF